jgi:hypothetical protein
MFRSFTPPRIFLALAVAMFLAVPSMSHAQGKGKGFQAKRLTTEGDGLFFPANLGVGDPSLPTIVGDGSGYAAYQGATGNEFRLDGELVGDGWDEHFGAAQTITSGIVPPRDPSVVLYPYATANNPIRPGRRIHIMKTRAGEIWLQYTGFFTLTPAAGTLVSRSVFVIVGGTREFARAVGSVRVITTSNLAEATEAGVPFHYDFDGTIYLRKRSKH